MDLNGLNPYDVLGVPHGSDRPTVRNAYKRMVIHTHPDRTGDAVSFMMVHKAFAEIEKTYAFTVSDAPSEKPKYVPATQEASFNKNEKFNPNKFNAFFSENRINDIDPFNRGYDKYMSSRVNHQEEIDDMKAKKIARKKKEIIVYKEPEPINELYTQSYGLLGKDRVSDYSCGIGTDYMKAYADPDDATATAPGRKTYKNLDQLVKDRSTQSFALTDEDVRLQKEKEMKMRKLEQYRMSAYERSLKEMNESFIRLNNRIGN